MIKNDLAVAMAMATGLVAGCPAHGQREEPLQGVVELEERHLAFELPGRVASLKVQRGDRVDAGAVLGALDDALAKRQREARAAEARAAQAQRELVVAGSRPEEVRSASAEMRAAEALVSRLEGEASRSRKLAASGVEGTARVEELDAELARAREQVVSIRERVRMLRGGARKEEIDLAGARADAAAAALAAEDERLARHVLRAPGPGRVLDVHVKEGEVVAAGAPVVTLAEPQRPHVDVFVPEARLPAVRLGAAARVRVDGEGAPFAGKVEHIASQTEFTPRFLFSPRERPNLVVRVRVRLDDPGERLHAGVPAFVTIEGAP